MISPISILSPSSFKERLYLLIGLVAFALVLFSVFAIYNIHDGSENLSAVHERQVEPAAALLEMEGALKDVRFRLAGFLLDQMPAVGNVQHLQEALARITSSWGNFLEKTRDNAFSDSERAMITTIGRNLGNIDVLFDKMEAAYRSDDKAALTAVLEDEWPFVIHVALLKPISHMVETQQAAVLTTYEVSVETGRQQIVLGIAFLTLIILLISAFAARIIKALTDRLDMATEIAKQVASGDWSPGNEDTSPDEVGHLLRAIHHMRGQVQSRQARLEAVLHYAGEAIITMDEQGLIESFNPAAVQLFGYNAAEAIGKNINLLMPEPHRSEHDGYLQHYRDTGEKRIIGKPREVQALHKGGRLFPVELNVSEMWVDGRRLFTGMLADISARKAVLEQLEQTLAQLNTREQRLRTILDNTAEGIITFDERGMIEGFNQSSEKLFGWDEDEVIGTSISQLISPEIRENRDGYIEHFMRAEIKRLIGHEGEVVGRHKDGSSFPMAVKITGMQLENRQKYIAMVSDIGERKALMEHLRQLAEHDGLTGLYNRTYFHGELERVVERVRRSEVANCALLYIDLDHFKYVNDTLGHAAGDKLLIEVARILARRARKSDLVARLGGDEFTVLMYDTKLELVEKVADSFRKQLAEFNFIYEGQPVTIGCSIGVAIIEPSAQSSAEIMSRADLACHIAKRAGRNQVHLFEPDDAKDVANMSLDMGWSRRIREAVEGNRFALACQPIVSTRSRETKTYEVLIRMLDDNGGLIMPGGFLPTAERFGLSLDIDRWVIIHAIETLAEQRVALPELCYTINLSAQTLNTPAICDLIQDKLHATGLDPAALIFEVTETAAISDLNAAAALLTRLRALGCRTALDDFGSGMSSFAYLKELPVDIVKIDGRFVKHIATSAVDQAMVRAMNDIAHALGKETIAEFVEDEAAFQILIELGVDYGQGYHLGRPDLVAPCNAIAAHAGVAKICRNN